MNAAGIAKTLMTKGQAMTLRRVAVGLLDPVTGGIEGGDEPVYIVYGITTNYGSMAKLASQNTPNSLILTGDKKAIISAGIVEPVPGDHLTIMEQTWTIIAVDALAPQGVVLMYTCQVRL